jgi:hypothetical protein
MDLKKIPWEIFGCIPLGEVRHDFRAVSNKVMAVLFQPKVENF